MDGIREGHCLSIPFGWTGMYREPFTNLYHTLYREYDPFHERWLSEDPAGYADGLNLYAAYMGLSGIDPLGLKDPWAERVAQWFEETFENSRQDVFEQNNHWLWAGVKNTSTEIFNFSWFFAYRAWVRYRNI